MRIILIGIQGAGKSTQGNLLSEKLNIPYLSTGHIFRDLAKEKTPEGRYIKETINAGYLLPDDKTLDVVEGYLEREVYKNGFILDGFPRTTAQAEAFKTDINYVFYLKVSDKEALWRISGRDDERDDETLKAIRKRIELFHAVTLPVLDFYKEKGKLIEINGEQSIEAINKEMLSKIS